MRSKIGVINYESGNTKSIVNALEYLECNYILSSRQEDLEDCSHLILPGVGSYSYCMENLKKKNLLEVLNELVLVKQKLFLGICVGMQLVTDKGLEFGEHRGLGWIRGTCEKLRPASGAPLRLPHVGWNEVTRGMEGFPLFAGFLDTPTFYFVHSYAIAPTESVTRSVYCSYGTEFVAAIQKENIFGVQFHPEKSQKDGLGVLKNFSQLA